MALALGGVAAGGRDVPGRHRVHRASVMPDSTLARLAMVAGVRKGVRVGEGGWLNLTSGSLPLEGRAGEGGGTLVHASNHPPNPPPSRGGDQRLLESMCRGAFSIKRTKSAGDSAPASLVSCGLTFPAARPAPLAYPRQVRHAGSHGTLEVS